jgi:hypothetical protein
MENHDCRNCTYWAGHAEDRLKIFKLRIALQDAAQSLRTVAKAGLEGDIQLYAIQDIRQFARSRAQVAQNALEASGKLEVKP